jgi:hypothetical protein
MSLFILFFALMTVANATTFDVAYPVCDTQDQIIELYYASEAEDVAAMEALMGVCGMIPQEIVDQIFIAVVETTDTGLTALFLSHPNGNELVVWTFSEAIK